jgi:soluble lytic murein transglycosylase-like protein
MRTKIKILISLILILVLGIVYYKSQFIFVKPEGRLGHIEWQKDVPSIQMYFAIKKYAKEYNIPEEYGFGIAFVETGYKGPLHFDYDHKQTSSAGALGPMQVMPNTAKLINGTKPTNEKLKSDIDYNVKTSMKLLRHLKDKYGDWLIVFGCYNTGKPIINSYARKVFNKQYSWKDNV